MVYYQMVQSGTVFDRFNDKKANPIHRGTFLHLCQNTQKRRFTLIEDPEKTGAAMMRRKSKPCLFTAGEKKYAGRRTCILLSISTNMVQEFLWPSYQFFFLASSMQY